MAENTRFVETKGDSKMFGSMSSEDFERLIAAGKVTEDLIDAFRRSREELVVTREEYKNLRDALDELEEESELFANGFTNNINKVLNGLQALGQTKLTTNLFKGALSNVGNINKELQAASMSGVQLSDKKFDSLSLKLSTASINFSSALSRISETLGVSQDLLQKISEEGADESILDSFLNKAVALQQQTLLNSELSTKEKSNQLRTIEDTIDAIIALSHSELQYQKTLTDTGKLLESQKNTQFEINKALTGRTGLTTKVGVAGTLGKVAEKIGWKPLQQELQKQESVGKQKATEEFHIVRTQKLGEGKSVKEAEQAGLAAAKVAGNKAVSLAGAIGTALKTTVAGVVSKLALDMVTAIFKVSTEAANVKREIGQWGIGVATGNAAFASTKDTLIVIQDIVKSIGMNPVTVFTDKELGKMAEAKNILGLTTEQAVGLGIKSKLAGVGADAYRDAIARGNNEVNRYGIAHGQVLDGVLEASDAITLSLGNQPGKIASAVVMAKSLGLELREIENIQQSLLSFESSIENEMKAQLLTGRNINLNKAREYALMNDLEGVAREIKQQGVDMATFGEMNVIQQESLAKALGMSREQLAKSIILQEMQNGLSAEAIAQSMNMNKESVEAMGIQERWTKSVEQLKEAFTPILSILIPIAQFVSMIVSRIGWAIGGLQKLSGYRGIKGYDSVTNNWTDGLSNTKFFGYKETPSAKKTNEKAGIESEIAELEKLKRREGDKSKHDELQAKIDKLRSKSTILQQEIDKIADSGAKIGEPIEAGTNILGTLLTLTLGVPVVVNVVAGAATKIKAFAGSVVSYYKLAGTRIVAFGKTVWSITTGVGSVIAKYTRLSHLKSVMLPKIKGSWLVQSAKKAILATKNALLGLSKWLPSFKPRLPKVEGSALTDSVKSVGNKAKPKWVRKTRAWAGRFKSNLKDAAGKNLGQQAVDSQKGTGVPSPQQGFNGKKLNKAANDISSSEKKLSGVNTKTFSRVANAVSSFFRKLSKVRTAKISALPGAATSAASAVRIIDSIKKPTGINEVALSIQSFFSQLHKVKTGKALKVALISGLLAPGLAMLGGATRVLPGKQKMRDAGKGIRSFFSALSKASKFAVKALPAVAVIVGAAIGIGFAAKLLGEGISKVVNSINSFIPALVAGLTQLSNIEFTKLLGVGASLLLFGGGLTVALLSLVGAFLLGRPALLGVSMLSTVLAKLGEVDTSKFSTIKTDLIDLGEGVRALSVVEDVKVGRLNRLSRVLARFKGLAGIGAELKSFATGMQALSLIPLEVPEPEKLNLDQVVTTSQQVKEKNTIQSEDQRKTEAEKANQVIKVEKEESKNTEIDQRILAVLSRIEGTLKNPIKLDWDDREFRMYQASIGYSS